MSARMHFIVFCLWAVAGAAFLWRSHVTPDASFCWTILIVGFNAGVALSKAVQKPHPAYFKVVCGGCHTSFRELTKGPQR